MYGTKDAALNWAAEYSATPVADGYEQGQASPCLFFHPGKDVAIMIHVEDFVAIGSEKDLADTRAIRGEVQAEGGVPRGQQGVHA